jgi:hypothetical protein
MLALGINVRKYGLRNEFSDYLSHVSGESPFHYIAWSDLHQVLSEAAKEVGAGFVYESRVTDFSSLSGIVVDATGIAGAARRHMPHRYSGLTIYRGLSQVNTDIPFVVVRYDDKIDSPYALTAGGGTSHAHVPGHYFNVAHTRFGAAWAFFLDRPEPAHFSTDVTSKVPPEVAILPPEFQEIVNATPEILVSPMSDWVTPAHMREDALHYRIGDVNGPVRPVTTSGANLAILEGFALPLLTGNAAQARTAERDMLARRAFDLRLGAELEAPEIGGDVEDDMFQQHHQMLFPGDVISPVTAPGNYLDF